MGRRAAAARQPGNHRGYGGIAVLLLGLAASGCVGSGQLASLTEPRRTAIAFESIDGPPPAVSDKFARSLKDEAGARRIAVVSPGEAGYRLRAYLAAHTDGSATSVAWALDVYDADQRRAFRLSGEEKAAGRTWTAADDRVLQRIASAGMQQFAALAAARPTAAPALAEAPPVPQRGPLAFGWTDDWAPEASGIFRVFRREPAKPEIAADAGPRLPPDEVPLPRRRPAPSDAPVGGVFAFAPEDR